MIRLSSKLNEEDYNNILQIIDVCINRGGIIPPDAILEVGILRDKIKKIIISHQTTPEQKEETEPDKTVKEKK